jgi:phosphoheptose isomerase
MAKVTYKTAAQQAKIYEEVAAATAIEAENLRRMYTEGSRLFCRKQMRTAIDATYYLTRLAEEYRAR